MKNKTYLISNFKFNPINNNNNELTIKSIFNVNSNNGILTSELNTDNIFKLFFNEDEISNIELLNQSIIHSLKQIIPYSYFCNENNNPLERLFALTINNELYELNYQTFIFNEIYNFSITPKIILHNNFLYFFDLDDNCLVIQNSNLAQIEKIPTISNFIEYDDKIFFTYEKYPNIFFESEKTEIIHLSTNHEQYTNYKINNEDGIILKIFIIKNKIYILTQYSIYHFDENKKSINKITSTNLYIFKTTICQIDNTLIFLTPTGFYLFDGVDLTHLSLNYLNFSNSANLICFNRNLFIYDENNADFVHKFNFKTSSFTPIKIIGLQNIFLIQTINNYSLCANIYDGLTYKNVSLYENKENSLQQEIVFNPFTFNSTFDKTIKNIFINSDGDFEFIISSNHNTERTYKIQNNTQLNNIDIYGSVFNFKIISSSNFKLNSILILLEEDS